MHSLNNGCIYKVENSHFLLMQHVQIQCDRDIILCILKAKPTINHTGSPPRLWDHQSEHTSAASCQVRVPWREGGCNWMYFLVTNISYQRIIHWLKLTDITFQVNKSSLFHDHIFKKWEARRQYQACRMLKFFFVPSMLQISFYETSLEQVFEKIK